MEEKEKEKQKQKDTVSFSFSSNTIQVFFYPGGPLPPGGLGGLGGGYYI